VKGKTSCRDHLPVVQYIILEPEEKKRVVVKLDFYYGNDRVGWSSEDKVPMAMAFGSVLWNAIKTPHHGASASFLLQRVTAPS
jgi:hypothetical protein